MPGDDDTERDTEGGGAFHDPWNPDRKLRGDDPWWQKGDVRDAGVYGRRRVVDKTEISMAATAQYTLSVGNALRRGLNRAVRAPAAGTVHEDDPIATEGLSAHLGYKLLVQHRSVKLSPIEEEMITRSAPQPPVIATSLLHSGKASKQLYQEAWAAQPTGPDYHKPVVFARAGTGERYVPPPKPKRGTGGMSTEGDVTLHLRRCGWGRYVYRTHHANCL
jgi:hypothetical protein